jgi:hypothetical protein
MKATGYAFKRAIAGITCRASFLAVLTSCAYYNEGVVFTTFPDKDEATAADGRLEHYHREAIAAGTTTPETSPGTLLIGRTGPFRSFSNERVFLSQYARHEAWMSSRGKQASALSREEYREYAGWTSVTIERTPFYFRMQTALVPEAQLQNLGFSSVLGSGLLGTREDLVAARHTSDNEIVVITDVLCPDGPGFGTCARQYEPGIYDLHTGRELTVDYRIKANGIVIDTRTFRKVAPPRLNQMDQEQP